MFGVIAGVIILAIIIVAIAAVGSTSSSSYGAPVLQSVLELGHGTGSQSSL